MNLRNGLTMNWFLGVVEDRTDLLIKTMIASTSIRREERALQNELVFELFFLARVLLLSCSVRVYKND